MPTWRLLFVALGLATACHRQGAALTTSAKTSPARSTTGSEAPADPVDPVSVTQIPELDIFATTVRVIVPNVEDAVEIDARDDHDPPQYCARLRSGLVAPQLRRERPPTGPGAASGGVDDDRRAPIPGQAGCDETSSPP